MQTLLNWVAYHPFPSAFLILTTGIILLLIAAYIQGRDILFWPPSISGKPLAQPIGDRASTNVMDAIMTRKSVRIYTTQPVEADKLQMVLEAARLAPSASNRQEWRFVVVQNFEIKQRLAQATPGLAYICSAPVVIAACAETDEHVMQCGQMSYPIDVAIALDHISLEAVEQGLGTCWVGMFDENKVKQTLGIPSQVRVVELMALGYPANPGRVEKKRLPIDKTVKYDRWN
jgi:nitroreductase